LPLSLTREDETFVYSPLRLITTEITETTEKSGLETLDAIGEPSIVEID
jgi:hypothetical protein